ncbi:hypothetical protein BrnapMp036 (mitochondrion) [Brassica napus]|uniref:ORF108a n=7 Tax=Brassiceae TaxID=981071 RepID=Q6YSQ6_BRANA|nr:orf108a [Brassica oleracea]YP_004927754.1 orf108a [Brassica juncea]YP_004927851.1 orf108a [Brassica rapa subsp. oleifera]YP_717133.1 hypothetical protein BrnapMp036 [Brassica napus]AHY20330.1 hypothetical protein [Brassica juncea var. tumida]AOW69039.1 orf108a [Brassica oleracea var. capitata]AEH43426.1 orf108a [Brassica rapa subsp. oleifera]AEH43536.1 orf108a [Brassica oleracea]AEH43651.1 orf108a [Brassica juncea]
MFQFARLSLACPWIQQQFKRLTYSGISGSTLIFNSPKHFRRLLRSSSSLGALVSTVSLSSFEPRPSLQLIHTTFLLPGDQILTQEHSKTGDRSSGYQGIQTNQSLQSF